MVLNTRPLDWESSTLTTRPLIDHSKKSFKTFTNIHCRGCVSTADAIQGVSGKYLREMLDSEFSTERKWSWKYVLSVQTFQI